MKETTKCYCGHTTYCDCGEESKQETQGYICPSTKKQCDDECCVSAEDCHIEASFGILSDCEPPKQETLEEVAENFRKQNPGTMQGGNNTKILNSFKAGAKWMQDKLCDPEFIQKLRGTKSDAEFRRLIKNL